ncbi:MAG: DNA alkylation repair protein [Acutalibacteraceae bacterium]|nr:DNA alkylation repair protein [Acutalibacteraceae bacterium]
MFTKADYDLLLKHIEGLANEKHRNFHSSLVPDVNNILGIPVPELRKTAKLIVKNCDDIDAYLAICSNKYYEELMLKGIVIGCVSCSWDKKLEYIKAFVPLIYDWAVCDTFCSGIKPPEDKLADFRSFIEPYLNSDKEFEIRFAVVILLQQFITVEYIDSTLLALQNINSDKYYVKMAVAWALSVCFVKFPEETEQLFAEYKLDKWVQNKAIQKCRESLRVSKQDKELLLKYKIN